MSKFVNWVKQNPVTAGGGGLLFIAIISFLVWFFLFRKSEVKLSAGPGESVRDKPQIILKNTQKILHPNKSGVETYILEYATGDSSARYIDIKINWSNGGGFEMSGVTALKFTRKSGSNIIDTIITTDLPDSDKYITDFESDLSVIFRGTADVDQYLSNGNIPIGIVIEYITDGDPQSLATTSADITESDLDTTLNIDSITTINSSPVMGGNGFTSVLDTTSTKTVYSIMFGDGTPIPELQEIRMKVDSNGWIEFHKGGKQVNIQGKDDTTQTYKFAEFGEDSGKYLFLGRFNNTGDGGYLIYTKKSDAVTGWSFTGSTLAVGLSNILADKAVYDRAFVGIIPTIPTVRCRYVRFAKTEDITNWGDRIINLNEVYVYDSSGTNVARGKTVMHDSTTTPYYKNIGKNLVDGDDVTMATSGDDVKQNNNQPQRQWIQIDLGSEMELSSIKVIDRPGYPTRLDKVKIQLLNASGTVVHTSPELTTAAANKGISHTYTISTQTWEHSTTAVSYKKLPVDDTNYSYVSVPSIDGSPIKSAGTIGDLRPCVEYCDNEPSCVGFNETNNKCHFKSITLKDVPSGSLTFGKDVTQQPPQPINYYINPNRDSYMDESGVEGAHGTPNKGPTSSDDLSQCKLKCLADLECKSIVHETGPDGYKLCAIKTSNDPSRFISSENGWTNKNDSVTYKYYKKNDPA